MYMLETESLTGTLPWERGELNLPHMIDELDKAAYPYYLSLEILNNLYTRNPEYAMKKSYDWLVGYISGSIRPQEG